MKSRFFFLTKQQINSGAMIALYPPLTIAQRLALFNGESVEQLHLTIAFLGKADQLNDVSRLTNFVKQFAQEASSIQAKLNGVARFVGTDSEGDPFVLLIDSPQLPDFRQSLIKGLQEIGVQPVLNHGFIPHITLDYIPSESSLPKQTIEPMSVNFDILSLVIRNERFDYRLGQMQKERPTMRQVHIPSTSGSMQQVSKPWTINQPPPPAKNWSESDRKKCVSAANAALVDGKSEREAIMACIGSVKKGIKIMNNDTLLKVNGDEVTLGNLAQVWLEKQNRFTDAPWNTPRSQLSPEDYAKVSLVDINPPGEEKTKERIRLPVRSRPGGPINRNALRNAASRISQIEGVPQDALKRAARSLVRLMREAGIEVGTDTLQFAGMSAKSQEVKWDFEVIEKDKKRQVVYGLILRPEIPDGQGDWIATKDAVMDAAHTFMAKQSGAADWLHEKDIERAEAVLVESVIMGTDVESWHGKKVSLREGDWVGGMWVRDPEKWEAIENEEIQAFSIKGFGRRRSLNS